MITNPTDLYSNFLSDYKLPEQILCDLHKPCNHATGHRCTTVLTHKVINFDDVKTEYQRGKKGPQKASVDGFTYKGKLFCFVELKGWADFLDYNTNPNTLKMKIKKQVAKYDLNKKLTDSMLICKDIASNPGLFKGNSIAFILVTDIDVVEDGAKEICSDLISLAETSTDWKTICNQELKGKLSSLPTNINTYYINCQKFDETISKL